MSLTPIHLGKILNGKFVPDNPEFFKVDLEGLEGLDIAVTVTVVRRTRSLELNKFYFGQIVRPLTEFFNREKTLNRIVDTDFVHELLKAKFLGLEKIPVAGEIVEKINSSRKLTNKEFVDYCDFCMAWCNELFNLNLDWPEPKEERKTA